MTKRTRAANRAHTDPVAQVLLDHYPLEERTWLTPEEIVEASGLTKAQAQRALWLLHHDYSATTTTRPWEIQTLPPCGFRPDLAGLEKYMEGSRNYDPRCWGEWERARGGPSGLRRAAARHAA
jgi:hypothetical protein